MQEIDKREQARQYAKEYRESGFGRLADKRYYKRHRAEKIRRVVESRRRKNKHRREVE